VKRQSIGERARASEKIREREKEVRERVRWSERCARDETVHASERERVRERVRARDSSSLEPSARVLQNAERPNNTVSLRERKQQVDERERDKQMASEAWGERDS